MWTQREESFRKRGCYKGPNSVIFTQLLQVRNKRLTAPQKNGQRPRTDSSPERKSNGPRTFGKMLNFTVSEGIASENYPEIQFSPPRLANILTTRCAGEMEKSTSVLSAVSTGCIGCGRIWQPLPKPHFLIQMVTVLSGSTFSFGF